LRREKPRRRNSISNKKDEEVVVKKFLLKISINFLVLVIPSIALACSFDTDCGIGSRCVKSMGSIYGVCMGGLNPGNSYDRQPVYAPMDMNRTYGNTCSFDTDCGIGSQCVKSGGIYGTCVKKGF
jgi:hypothetical protein